MAICCVPAQPERPTPADGDDYTYARTPAPQRQAEQIAKLEARIAELETEQQIAVAEHGDAIATLEAEIKGLAATTAGALAMVEARIAALERPAKQTRRIMARLFDDDALAAAQAGGHD